MSPAPDPLSTILSSASSGLPFCFFTSTEGLGGSTVAVLLTPSRRGAIQDPRLERLPCNHKGTYADDCLVDRVKQHRCYIVATCDRDLRRRIRKVCTPFARGGGDDSAES